MKTLCQSVIGLLLIISPALAALPAPGPTPDAVREFGFAEILLICEVLDAQAGPTAMSEPPIHNTRLKLQVLEALRGTAKAGEKLNANHAYRGPEPPEFTKREKVVVVGEIERRSTDTLPMNVVKVLPADEKLLEQARSVAALPIGWFVEDGRIVSPWSRVDGYDWPQQTDDGVSRGAVTGRPALLAGPVTFQVAPVIVPEKQIQWTNPDGDGEYRITVTNPTDQPLTVPALLRSGEMIRWDQSVTIVCQDKAYVLPGTTRPPADLAPVTLEPGASVSGVVNVLALRGPDWPRGGQRVQFTFCLGEHGSTQSFYYMSRHHDALRDRALHPAGR